MKNWNLIVRTKTVGFRALDCSIAFHNAKAEKQEKEHTSVLLPTAGGMLKEDTTKVVPLSFVSDNPLLDIYQPFDTFCDLARNELKRELLKEERKALFDEYVRACNRSGLIVLNQHTKPIELSSRQNLWREFEGSMIKYCLALTKALGRDMTRKEGVFFKEQWRTATKVERVKVVDCSAWSKHSAIKLKELAIQRAGTSKTRGKNFDVFRTFNYKHELKLLKSALKAGSISHSEYNAALADLKNKRREIEAHMRQAANTERSFRNMDNNTGACRVVHNATGYAPEIPATQSKRYAQDGHQVDVIIKAPLIAGGQYLEPATEQEVQMREQYLERENELKTEWNKKQKEAQKSK